MPPLSTIKQFVNALKERRSKSTKGLDIIFRSPGKYKNTPIHTHMKKSGALKRPLAAWASKELVGAGLTRKEINHINKWPDTQKEKLREVFLRAIDKGQRLRFFWELYGGNTEDTAIPKPLPKTGAITIVFRSPQKRVRVAQTAKQFGEVLVEVG